VLLELFGLLFFVYCASVLSSILVFVGVFRWLSTEKAKAQKRGINPVEKRMACRVCGAHALVELDKRRTPWPGDREGHGVRSGEDPG
jgi:hypothetical protein